MTIQFVFRGMEQRIAYEDLKLNRITDFMALREGKLQRESPWDITHGGHSSLLTDWEASQSETFRTYIWRDASKKLMLGAKS